MNVNYNEHCPLVTVVTVTYNLIQARREDYFRQCIESVCNQDYSNIEHIVVDGDSNDGTLSIIREYEKLGKIKVYSEPDRGIYDAMNKAIALAKGKYTIFLNSDDFWNKSTAVSLAVKALEMGKGDFSYGGVVMANPDGSVNHYYGALLGAFQLSLPFCHQSMMCKTKLLRQYKGFNFEKFPLVADYDLGLRLLLAGAKPIYVPYCSVAFRLGGESSNDNALRNGIIEVLKHHFGDFIGDKCAVELINGRMPVKLFTMLRTMVHPVVACEMSAIMKQEGDSMYIRFRIPIAKSEEQLSLVGSVPLGRVRLLGIPFMHFSYKKNDLCIKLFGLSILRKKIIIKKDAWGISSEMLLFGFIPLWKSKRNHRGWVKLSVLGIPFISYINKI